MEQKFQKNNNMSLDISIQQKHYITVDNHPANKEKNGQQADTASYRLAHPKFEKTDFIYTNVVGNRLPNSLKNRAVKNLDVHLSVKEPLKA